MGNRNSAATETQKENKGEEKQENEVTEPVKEPDTARESEIVKDTEQNQDTKPMEEPVNSPSTTRSSIDALSEFGDSVVENMSLASNDYTNEHAFGLMEFVKLHSGKRYDVNVKLINKVKRLIRPNILTLECECKDLETNVTVFKFTRNYDEFEVLASNLRDSLPGVFTPTISKLIVKDSGFDKDTRILMAVKMFMETLMLHPFLKTQHMFKDFIKSKEIFTNQRAIVLKTEESDGYNRWLEMIDSVDAPRMPLNILKSAHFELGELVGYYKALKRDLNDYIGCLQSEKSVMNRLNSNFNEVEKARLPLVNASITDDNGHNLSLQKLIETVQDSYNDEDVKLDEKIKLLTKLRHDILFEIGMVIGYRYEIKSVKKSMGAFEKAEKRVELYEKEIAHRIEQLTVNKEMKATADEADKELHVNVTERKSTTSIDIESDYTLQSFRKKHAEVKGERDEIGKKYRAIVKGLLVIELQRFRHQRAVRNTSILRNLCNINENFARFAATSWKNSLDLIPSMVSANSDIMLLKKLPEEDKVEPPLMKFRAILEFTKTEDCERSLKLEEIVTGIRFSDNPDWIWIPREGYAPASHLAPLNDNDIGVVNTSILEDLAEPTEEHKVTNLDQLDVDKPIKDATDDNDNDNDVTAGFSD